MGIAGVEPHHPPRRCLEEAVEKHEMEKQKLFQQRLEGESLSESPPVAFSNLSNITNTATIMKRE
jgi:hypothetical protein